MHNLNNEIHIWHTVFKEHIKYFKLFQTWLSLEERIKAKTLVLPFRQNFVVSRGILRALLSKYSGQSPEKITFSYTQFGKPVFINQISEQIEFNLSHSHNRIAFAFTKNTPIGIDIEYKKARKYLDKIAYRFFTAQDYQRLKNLHGEEKLNTFFDLWVRNEALLKVSGQRLRAHPLSNYKTIHNPAATKKAQERFTVFSLTLHADFAGAIAIEGKNKPFQIRTLDSLT